MKKFTPYLLILISLTTNAFGIVVNEVDYNDETVSQLITVITSTHPIPSQPDTYFIYQAQKSLFRIPALAKCKKIIVFDGVAPIRKELTDNYELYKKAVIQLTERDPYFANTELIFCDQWLHLAGAMKEAMKQVTTPFIFAHQHDEEINKDFDLNGIIATMTMNKDVKCVLLCFANHSQNCYVPYSGPSFVTLGKINYWYDPCQVASSDYYRDFVLPQCHHTFMENVMIPGLRCSIDKYGFDEGHKPYGVFLYGRPEDGWYFNHLSGSPPCWNLHD